MIKTFDNFLLEFQQQDISLLESMDDYFTIGFEIEMDTDQRRIGSLPRPPKEITNESKEITYSIQDRKKVMDIKLNFPNFWKQYFNVIEFHYDETVSKGIEIVSKKPFNSIQESKDFIKIFFNDFQKQNKWYFTNKTSIHINIGSKLKKEWNIVKGMIMLSDQYTFKNIEDRKTSGFCNSLKDEVKFEMRTQDVTKVLDFIYSNDVKKIENIIDKYLRKLIIKNNSKKFNINFWKLIDKGYVEFRAVGGDELNESIIINKMTYFIYCVYLMTSKYKHDEYIKKLFVFKKSLGEVKKSFIRKEPPDFFKP
jgi:hypothetical protein